MFIALHIPDGFLSLQVATVGWGLTAVLVACALGATRHQLGDRQVPMMGVMGAFIFAAQALNFPIAGGTSGHLLGAALAAIVVGPWAAALVMACVIGLQGLLFADGGLLTMGWNIFNMGIFAAFVGHVTYRDVQRILPLEGALRTALAAFLAGWLSVILSAASTSLEIAASGTSPLAIVLPAMVGVHLFMGVGEGVVTAAAVLWLARVRPATLDEHDSRGASGVAVGLLTAFALCALAPLASSAPDGLDRIAQRMGFEHLEQKASGPMADYKIPFLGDTAVSTILAMLVGAAVLCLLCGGLGFVLTRRRTPPAA